MAAKVQTTMHSRMVRPLGPGSTTANFSDPAAPIKASDVQFVIGTNESNYFVGKDFNYLPATWNATDNEWGTRGASPWLTSCGQCHTTGYDSGLKTFVATNITCESCHGGGAKHVATGGDPCGSRSRSETTPASRATAATGRPVRSPPRFTPPASPI